MFACLVLGEPASQPATVSEHMVYVFLCGVLPDSSSGSSFVEAAVFFLDIDPLSSPDDPRRKNGFVMPHTAPTRMADSRSLLPTAIGPDLWG